MVVVHRSKLENYASILRSANNYNGAGITKLMYDSFTSHAQLKRNLIEMVESGLLICEDNSTRYRVTVRGLKFLALLDRMNNILKIEN